jgi:hypothetical protein
LRISFGGWRIPGDGYYAAVADMLHTMMIRREMSDWSGLSCMYEYNGERMMLSLSLSPSPSPARGISAWRWITST